MATGLLQQAQDKSGSAPVESRVIRQEDAAGFVVSAEARTEHEKEAKLDKQAIMTQMTDREGSRVLTVHLVSMRWV